MPHVTDRDDIAAGVRALLALRFDSAATLAAETSLDGLGVDSATLLTLVIGLEERFGMEIADDEITRQHFATVGAVTDFVAGRLGMP